MNMLVALLTASVVVAAITAQSCNPPTNSCLCYVDEPTQKKVITCRYQNLTAIPTFNSSSEVFDRIEFTSVEATGQCPSTQRCNNIQQLPADAFRNLKVKEIDLRRNAISSIDLHAFRGLENVLESLFIEGDGAIVPPYSSLEPLQILKSLHLENFNQTEFSETNTNLNFSSLTALTIEHFQSLTIMRSAAFGNVPNIETLKLSKLPSLTSLPVLMILSLEKLKTLDLFETGITSILGESFKGLSLLTTVEIKSNKYLNTISSNAFDGVSNTIKFLSLFQNALTDFNFLKQTPWPQLTQLNIGYNIAQISPGTFATMPNLNYLILADMSIQGITRDMFTGLTALHTLDLGYNLLTTIPADVFQNTPNLVDLRLNNQNENDANAQFMFDATAFASIETSLQHFLLEKNRVDGNQLWDKIGRFVNLIELNLAEIGLTTIPNNAFRNNVKLEKLELSSNAIETVQQETFFGPRNTLRSIHLYGNKIETVNKCVLSQFTTQPEIFLTGNPLQCDCQLIWLWNLVQTDSSLAFTHVGTCTSPSSLAGKHFTEFQVSDLVCSSGFVEPVCQDLYSTTTTTTTTTSTTSTTTPTTTKTTQRPTPDFTTTIIYKEPTKMTVTWSVTDSTYVTGYKMEIIKAGQKTIQFINKEETEIIVDRLEPETFYQFCLILKIENEYREFDQQCDSGSTPAEVLETIPMTTPMTTPAPEAQRNIAVVIGSAVGGVILVALIIVIIFFIMKSKKPKKRTPITQPISYTQRADLPHAGGTAKRHAKKLDKEGASPDDITVNVISSGDINNDRMSAGSYQYIKDNYPSGVNLKPMTNGHYVNNIETRALPQMPNGSRARGGYVNDGFHSGATNYPETSLNTYSEVVN